MRPFVACLGDWRGGFIPFAVFNSHLSWWLVARPLGDVLQHSGTKPRGFGGLVVDGEDGAGHQVKVVIGPEVSNQVRMIPHLAKERANKAMNLRGAV